MKKLVLLFGLLSFHSLLRAESGHNLGLRGGPVEKKACFVVYQSAWQQAVLQGASPHFPATKKELQTVLTGLLQWEFNESVWWGDACLQYLQTFSRLLMPAPYDKPAKPLEYYKKLHFPFAPGIY